MHTEPSTVRKVSVISTGSGSIHPEHMYGTRKPAYWWILTSKQWVPIPVNVFVIEHDDGIVLFDTGLDPRVISDPEYWRNRITRGFMSRIFRFELGPDETLASQLRSAGYEPSDVIKADLQRRRTRSNVRQAGRVGRRSARRTDRSVLGGSRL